MLYKVTEDYASVNKNYFLLTEVPSLHLLFCTKIIALTQAL